MNNYWIKLYHEILHDPKMGMLPDNVWRRCIELFLLAGEIESDGDLPSTAEIAWLLRQPVESLEAELQHLVRAGVLRQTESGWFVVKFRQRQSKIDNAQKQRDYRDRNRAQNSPPSPPSPLSPLSPPPPPPPQPPQQQPPQQPPPQDDHLPVVTEPLPVVTQITDTDTDTDTEEESSRVAPAPACVAIKPPPPPGEIAVAVLGICQKDYEFVTETSKLKSQLLSTLKLLAKNDSTAADVAAFEEWRNRHHWTRGSPPTLVQVGEFWGEFQTWIKAGKPEKVNGKDNDAHSKSTTNLAASSSIQKRYNRREKREYWFDTINQCEVSAPT